MTTNDNLYGILIIVVIIATVFVLGAWLLLKRFIRSQRIRTTVLAVLTLVGIAPICYWFILIIEMFFEEG